MIWYAFLRLFYFLSQVSYINVIIRRLSTPTDKSDIYEYGKTGEVLYTFEVVKNFLDYDEDAASLRQRREEKFSLPKTKPNQNLI